MLLHSLLAWFSKLTKVRPIWVILSGKKNTYLVPCKFFPCAAKKTSFSKWAYNKRMYRICLCFRSVRLCQMPISGCCQPSRPSAQPLWASTWQTGYNLSDSAPPNFPDFVGGWCIYVDVMHQVGGSTGYIYNHTIMCIHIIYIYMCVIYIYIHTQNLQTSMQSSLFVELDIMTYPLAIRQGNGQSTIGAWFS